MKRYAYGHGHNPEIKGAFSITGPQNEDQVPEHVRKILEQPMVRMVAIVYQQPDLSFESINFWANPAPDHKNAEG